MTDATQEPGTADKDTAALLARALASLEGVTPGPFSVFSEWDVWTGEPDSPGTPLVSPDRTFRSWGRKISDEEHVANARFFAASRQNVPDLIEALRAALARVQALERALTEIASYYDDCEPGGWTGNSARAALKGGA